MSNWWWPLAGLLAFEALADVLAVLWARGRPAYFALLALCAYVVCNGFWLWALARGSGLMRGANLFSVGSAMLATGIGWYAFDERMTRSQILGLALGFTAMGLLFWGQPEGGR
jgi:drug/metabolite transporter (DMT)-like permease